MTITQTDLQNIAQSLGKPRKTSVGYDCCCPCHDDKDPSLGITISPSGNLVCKCRSGCEWQNVFEEIKRRGLIPNSNGYQSKPDNNVKYHVYHDINGNPVSRKAKTPDKTFWNERSVNGEWIKGLAGFKSPLYNLPHVSKSDLVYLCEGEKDADTLISRGLIATSTNTGSSTWEAQFTEQLRGKTVIILPDNDKAGREYVDLIKKELSGNIRELYIFDELLSENNPPKFDITDWINAGGNADEIIFKAKKLEIPKYIEPPKPPEKFLIASDWLMLPEVPAVSILPSIFDVGDKVVIIGESKTRKSFFALQLAFCLASGKQFLSFNASERKKVLLIQSEIRSWRYHSRCLKLLSHLAIEPSDLKDLIVINARGVESLIDLIHEQTMLHKPDVVIIDPFYKLIEGDENKAQDIKPILKSFDILSERSGASIVYVHHDSKGMSGEKQLTDRGSGSGVLARDFDSAMFISKHAKDDEINLVIEFVTRNYAPQPAIAVEWFNYGFTPTGLPPQKKTKKSSQKIPKVKFSELINNALSYISTQVLLGITEMGCGQFNEELEEADIPRRSVVAIRDVLVKKGYLLIQKNKASIGQSSKTVLFLDKVNTYSSASKESKNGTDDDDF